MNPLTKLRETCFLSEQEVQMLVSDIVDEDCLNSIGESKNRNVMAYYLRNAHYLPFSFISEVLEYRGGSSAAEAVFTLQSQVPFTISLDPYYGTQVSHYRGVADIYYGTSRNVMMDRGIEEVLENALLYGASQACGWSDKHNKVSWYSHTPKESTLYAIMDILEYAGSPHVKEDFVEHLLNTYEVKRKKCDD
jgi:hypothetical protein